MSYNPSSVSEPEFEQARAEIRSTLEPLFAQYPEYERAFNVMSIPERIIQFRVTWEDDNHQVQVNDGFRVQFSSVLGPYKGGLRLHESVNLSILKFLGFEQIFKNALTGLHMGGGKGGSNFSPKGKSDNEIRRFCYAFMRELSKHIGPDTDVPAGDIGVGGREVAYMFGAYKQLRNEWTGVLTGKGFDFGGSKIRPEATGYGLVYYATRQLQEQGTDWKGKKVLISGAGNVAQYAALKVIELGGSVLSLSDSKGTLLAPESGYPADLVHQIAELKLKGGYLKDLSTPSGFKYVEGSRPWTLLSSVDVALPCATQNEVNGQEAEALVKAGVMCVAEGANMPCDLDAIKVFEDARAKAKKGEKYPSYGPGKAANCGGVAVSGLEMAQNSARLQWSEAEVDDKLKDIMNNAYDLCYSTAAKFTKGDEIPSLVSGANIAGFLKVANAARATGDWW
ncbi:NADP-dependent glutamate dehydrogenase [Microbotryomycetes sp. JL201]|nr:NADP-dependent glutamate dehydrogenase [Microbotryomycetes sp. JL201]